MRERIPDGEQDDSLDQKPSDTCQDDHPAATKEVCAASLATGYMVWPASDSNRLTARRSFVQDMASRNAPRGQH